MRWNLGITRVSEQNTQQDDCDIINVVLNICWKNK